MISPSNHKDLHEGILVKTKNRGRLSLVIDTHMYFCMHTGKPEKRVLLYCQNDTWWEEAAEVNML